MNAATLNAYLRGDDMGVIRAHERMLARMHEEESQGTLDLDKTFRVLNRIYRACVRHENVTRNARRLRNLNAIAEPLRLTAEQEWRLVR